MKEKIVTFKLDMNNNSPLPFFEKNSDGFQAHRHSEFMPNWLKEIEIIKFSTCTDGKFLYITYYYMEK